VAPGWLGWRLSTRLWLTTAPALRGAAAVLAPSQWTAEVLRRRFPKVADRIHVVSLAASSRFRPEPDDDDVELRGSLRLPARYLLYVGRRTRRKNVAVLVEAYSEAAAADPSLPPLLLVGPAGDADKVLRRKIEAAGLEQRIMLQDSVGDEVLPAVYRGAEVLCFPCRYEGFGLPLVEAMASGCPVIASDEGALPETAGDAGVLLSPEDPAVWARAIVALCADTGRRRRLRDQGLARARDFSWQACAASTISILEGTLS
jgi:glycosyltransferase involved in cell wall biosynthesis